MEYYSAIKKNKIMPFAATLIILRAVNQTQKGKSHGITSTVGSQKRCK